MQTLRNLSLIELYTVLVVTLLLITKLGNSPKILLRQHIPINLAVWHWYTYTYRCKSLLAGCRLYFIGFTLNNTRIICVYVVNGLPNPSTGNGSKLMLMFTIGSRLLLDRMGCSVTATFLPNFEAQKEGY